MNNPWEEITKTWPDPIYLKDLDKLPGFPYSNGYFRNLVTGKECDAELKKTVLRIGKFPAIRRGDLAGWLVKRTA